MQATIRQPKLVMTMEPMSERRIALNIIKGSLGNMIEWFDWYVYAAFAIYFSAPFSQLVTRPRSYFQPLVSLRLVS